MGKLFGWSDLDGPPSVAETGVLIGPRHVLTSACALPRGNPWAMRFVPAYFNGRSLLGAGVGSWVSDARSAPGLCVPNLASAYDAMILRLHEPLGESLGYFGGRYYDPFRRHWIMTSYPHDAAGGEVPLYRGDVEVAATVPVQSAYGNALQVELGEEIPRGGLGSPFWFLDPVGDPQVIGTCAGNRRLAGAPPVGVVTSGAQCMKLILWARECLP